MRALFLLGTLKNSAQGFSNTQVLSELLVEELGHHGVESEVVRLAEHNIPPGTKTNMGAGDEWPGIVQKMGEADIIIFATPIWWGSHSSLMQRTLERLDELNDEIVQTGKSGLLNKVGGIVITGAEDGAQNIIGTLCNFMVWNGLSLPPACSLSYLGEGADTVEELAKKYRASTYTSGMARTMAGNLVHVAKLLKEHPLPTQDKDSQYLR